MDPPPEPPRTPPHQIITNPTTPPAPHAKTYPPRISCDISTRDPPGPFYWEYHNKPPKFEVSPLRGKDFRDRPTPEEWADRLGYKLPSGESVLSGRPDPSKLKPGAKLPPSIKEIDRLLENGDEDLKSPSVKSSTLEPKSHPGAFLNSVESQQEMADNRSSNPSSQKPKTPNAGLGLMLPPPLRGRGGQQREQTPTPISQTFNIPMAGAMPQPLLRGAALLQEMADTANPLQAEEKRAKVFMDRLPHVQAASRRLQGQLGIHGDETWPLPQLPDERNPFILEMNAIKIRAALNKCAAFAVPTDRESGKVEYLDIVANFRQKRMVMPAGQVRKVQLPSFEDEKKAREAEASKAVARMMDEGLQEAVKGLEDEGTSDVSSSPKSLFRSIGPSPAHSIPQTTQRGITAASEDEEAPATSQGSSSVDVERQERRQEFWDQLRNPRFVDFVPYEPAESDESLTPDTADGSDATGATPDLVPESSATPQRLYEHEGNLNPPDTSTASNENQEMRAPTHESDSASATSLHITTTFAPLSRELRTLSVDDNEVGGMQSLMDEAIIDPNTLDKGKGRGISSTSEDNSSNVSQDQHKVQGKQAISKNSGDSYMGDSSERYGKTIGLGRKELDVAASLRNHSVTFVESKVKERNPPVPQPEKMPNTLTEAICSYIPLEAKPILTLTLERVDPPVTCPTDKRCILLRHFEVGLDGVEGLCQGTAKIPETPAVIAERERRIGRIGTLKQGKGGFYKVLKHAQQKDQQYGKGYWYFFGVKFKQTGKERKLRKGGKWFVFGAPIEAVYHLDIKRSQENVNVVLGGGVDESGTATQPFGANFKRTQTLFSRGGVAPMDIWPGGQDWDDGVFEDVKAAMANNGLRVGFLYANTETFTSRPRGFPAAGKNQEEKKRKEPGPDMNEEEIKAMEKSMKPKKLSGEEIGAMLATSIIHDRARQDAEGS